MCSGRQSGQDEQFGQDDRDAELQHGKYVHPTAPAMVLRFKPGIVDLVQSGDAAAGRPRRDRRGAWRSIASSSSHATSMSIRASSLGAGASNRSSSGRADGIRKSLRFAVGMMLADNNPTSWIVRPARFHLDSQSGLRPAAQGNLTAVPARTTVFTQRRGFVPHARNPWALVLIYPVFAAVRPACSRSAVTDEIPGGDPGVRAFPPGNARCRADDGPQLARSIRGAQTRREL